jgi:hypothetical protein
LSSLQQILPDELVINKIYLIRGVKVMLDSDLAELYGIETKRLKEQVRRNIERFPEDFMFELTQNEYNNLIVSLRSQFATSKKGGTRYMPMAFSEHGVLMLSSILNNELAIKVNIQIMRVYTKLRNLLSTNKELLLKFENIENKLADHDEKIILILDYIKHLEQTKQQVLEYNNRKKIGFKN